jgi:hypothetical protein
VTAIGITEVPACGTNAEVLAYHGLDGPSIARTVLATVNSQLSTRNSPS